METCRYDSTQSFRKTAKICKIPLRFGKGFNNSRTPRFYGYFISAPMAVTFGTGAYERISAVVGAANMISQFAETDLVQLGVF